MSIETHLDADPTSLDSSVTDLESNASAISSAVDDLMSVKRKMADQEGSTAAKAVSSLGYAINGLVWTSLKKM
ncbi:hypothetical protein [Schaalia vaccimaxillae]|uniref:hypothetical protein n=1 Tax=Schaalia vaccimaxillae TaxID=183916 RepID=UPI0003B75D83|nr:hypothetical protein [Schaalia vaccimaxillae]